MEVALIALILVGIVAGVVAITRRKRPRQPDHGELGGLSVRAANGGSGQAIVSADEGGRIIYFNAAAERLFGCSAAEVLGSELTVLMPQRFHHRHEAGLRRFLHTGERRLSGTTSDLIGLRHDGEEVPLSLSLVDWEADGKAFFTATFNDISARLESEQATRELAAIVAGSTDAIVSWGLDGRVRSWNRGAERIYGYSAEEMLGRPHDVLMPPGERSDLPELLERVSSGGRIENLETARMRKDWRRIDVSLNVSPIVDETGRVIAASTISRDITEHKSAERRLAESARLFEMINDLVATCGFDGYFKQLNGAWQQILGWTPEELLPNPFIEIVHPEDRAAVESEVAKVAGGSTTAEFKIRIATKTGGWLWTEWSASPDLPAGNFHCVGRDISGRMEIERTLVAERRQLADAQQIASVGSWELDPSTGDRVWSAQQYRNHGLDPGDPPPTLEELLERIHPDDRPLVSARFAQIEAGLFDFNYTYRVVLPDGTVRAIEADGRPFVDPEGGVRLMATSRDVTAERDAERLKDDFFGLVSHELRTPLTSIIGYTELLTEIEAENLSEEGRRFVEVIDRNSRRELNLVGDLLLLTKITAGTFRIEVGRADLGELARTAVEHALPEAAKAGVEVVVEADAGPVIEADPHRLGQVLENLLSNAIKFTPRGGRVAIRAGRDRDTAVLEVADNGIGIPAEDCDRLFERMFRAREAEDRHIQGTGLGLTIVRAIVDAHGGSVSAESKIGEGATFRVELPLVAADRPAHPGDGDDGVGGSRRSPLTLDNE